MTHSLQRARAFGAAWSLAAALRRLSPGPRNQQLLTLRASISIPTTMIFIIELLEFMIRWTFQLIKPERDMFLFSRSTASLSEAIDCCSRAQSKPQTSQLHRLLEPRRDFHQARQMETVNTQAIQTRRPYPLARAQQLCPEPIDSDSRCKRMSNSDPSDLHRVLEPRRGFHQIAPRRQLKTIKLLPCRQEIYLPTIPPREPQNTYMLKGMRGPNPPVPSYLRFAEMLKNKRLPPSRPNHIPPTPAIPSPPKNQTSREMQKYRWVARVSFRPTPWNTNAVCLFLAVANSFVPFS